MESNNKLHNLSLLFSRNLFFLGFILLLLEHFTTVIVSKYISPELLFASTFLFLFLYIFLFIKENEGKYKPKFEPIFKYLFLLGLLVITIGSLNFEFIKEKETLNSIVSFISGINFYLSFFTIAFGFFTFYLNREKIEEETEREQEGEEFAEEKRKQEFPEKYPGINKIPVLRNIIRWTYKEGWIYSLGLIIIVLSAFFLFLQNIDHDFMEDEFLGVGAAAGYYHTSEFYMWDWIEEIQGERYYNRAWPHSWLIAQSFRIFGISEFSARIVPVVFGLLFLILSYFITKKLFLQKKFSLLVVFSLSLSPLLFDTFIYARMYALLIPLFFLLSYLIYSFLIQNNKFDFKIKELNRFVRKNLNFNYILLPIIIILLYFTYIIHPVSLFIFPITLLLSIYLAITKIERKYVILALVGSFLSFAVYFLYALGITDRHSANFTFLGQNNYIYLEYLTSFPFYHALGTILLFMGLLLVPFILPKRKTPIIYFYITVAFSLIFFIWFGDRYSHPLYISHIVPISIILILWVFFNIIKLFQKKYLLYLLLIIAIIGNFFYYQDNWLGLQHRLKSDFGSFTKAYSTIIENYDSEKEIIMGQYLRTYYLRDIEGNVKTICMQSYKKYSFDEFIEDIEKHEQGWITWESRKSYHLEPKIREYIEENFTKHHGRDVDDSVVEVYYFTIDDLNNLE